MSTEPATVTGKLSGWLKTLVGTVAGMPSGAVVMYASPWLEKAVKPAKPRANFQVEPPEGLAVTVSNRSVNWIEGWLDFGDGSALEPVTPDRDSQPHLYA